MNSLLESEYFTDFRRELSRILRMVRLAEIFGDFPSEDSPRGFSEMKQTSNTLFEASLVLTVAQCEGYIKHITGEFVDAINRIGVPRRNVPDSLVYIQTSGAFQQVVDCVDERERYRKFEGLREVLNLYWDKDRMLASNSRGPQGVLQKRVVIRQMTSLETDKFRNFAAKLGVNTAFLDADVELMDADALQQALSHDKQLSTAGDAGDPEAFDSNSTQIGEKLSDLIGKRNTIAHGNGTVSFTSVDLSGAISFFYLFSKGFTVELDAALGRMTKLV